MKINCVRIRNFRRLKDVLINFESDISIFVGANNSGKTPAYDYERSFLLFLFFVLTHQFVIAQQCLDTSIRRQYNAQNGMTVRSQQTLNDGSVLVNAFKTNPLILLISIS